MTVHTLCLTADQVFILHHLLTRAEDLAVAGNDFAELGKLHDPQRIDFVNLQVKVEEAFHAAVRAI